MDFFLYIATWLSAVALVSSRPGDPVRIFGQIKCLKNFEWQSSTVRGGSTRPRMENTRDNMSRTSFVKGGPTLLTF